MGTVMGNSGIFKFVPDQMCDKAILENGETLKSVPDGYKNQAMCNEAVE